jgi:hypothetical protein
MASAHGRIRFSQEVAVVGGLQTLRAYYSAFDHETGASVLLLEDLVRARVGDNFAGCSPEDVACVLRHLATFHATWWEHPRLVQLDWMPVFQDDADRIQGLYQLLHPRASGLGPPGAHYSPTRWARL